MVDSTGQFMVDAFKMILDDLRALADGLRRKRATGTVEAYECNESFQDTLAEPTGPVGTEFAPDAEVDTPAPAAVELWKHAVVALARDWQYGQAKVVYYTHEFSADINTDIDVFDELIDVVGTFAERLSNGCQSHSIV